MQDSSTLDVCGLQQMDNPGSWACRKTAPAGSMQPSTVLELSRERLLAAGPRSFDTTQGAASLATASSWPLPAPGNLPEAPSCWQMKQMLSKPSIGPARPAACGPQETNTEGASVTPIYGSHSIFSLPVSASGPAGLDQTPGGCIGSSSSNTNGSQAASSASNRSDIIAAGSVLLKSKAVTSTPHSTYGHTKLLCHGHRQNVYAYFVHCAVPGDTGCWQLLQAAVGMLLTFIVQLGVIQLLWYGMLTAEDPSKAYQATLGDSSGPPTSSQLAAASSIDMGLLRFALPVNMLMVFALSFYVYEEVRKAVKLSFVVVMLFGELPALFTTGRQTGSSSTTATGSESIGCFVSCEPVVHRRPLSSYCTAFAGGRCCCATAAQYVSGLIVALLVLLAPILQHVVAASVLVSGIGLTLAVGPQVDIIAIILNSTAVVFLLELDKAVGEILQAQHHSSHSSGIGELPLRSRRPQSNLVTLQEGMLQLQSRSCCMAAGVQGRLVWVQRVVQRYFGYAYIALNGLFVLALPLFLSPTVMYRLHGVIMHSTDGDAALASWSSALPDGVLGTNWQTYADAGVFTLNPQDIAAAFASPSQYAHVLAVLFYPLMTAAALCVLCGSMIPSASRAWGVVFLCAQVGMGVAPHFLAVSSYIPFSAVVLPGLLGAVWLGLFAVWPPLWAVAVQRHSTGACGVCAAGAVHVLNGSSPQPLGMPVSPKAECRLDVI